MEYTFTQLKKKTVISVVSGKKLGKVSDITVSFPENCFISLTVTPCNLSVFSQDKIIITPCQIEKIGEDAILVKQFPNKPRCEEIECDE